MDVSNEKLPYRAKRHYSIVEGDNNHLVFGVKRDVTTNHEGEVSTILHDEIKEGDTIHLSAPVGGFSIENIDKPQLFIGSGVGMTPLVSMYKKASSSNVTTQLIQVVNNEKERPFAEELDTITSKYEQAHLYLHVKDQEGYLEAKELEEYLKNKPEVYICGGTNFLQSIINALKSLDYDMDSVHFETFVPRLSVQV